MEGLLSTGPIPSSLSTQTSLPKLLFLVTSPSAYLCLCTPAGRPHWTLGAAGSPGSDGWPAGSEGVGGYKFILLKKLTLSQMRIDMNSELEMCGHDFFLFCTDILQKKKKLENYKKLQNFNKAA